MLKKYFSYLFVIFISCFFFRIDVFADVDSFRFEQDYLMMAHQDVMIHDDMDGATIQFVAKNNSNSNNNSSSSSSGSNNNSNSSSSSGNNNSSNSSSFSGSSSSSTSGSSLINNNAEDLNLCTSMKDSGLLEQVKTIYDIFRIAVPIIIIGFGVIDFSKGVFASDEEQMKKTQKKFMQRLLIGVAFFLVPAILGLLLKIANAIWSIGGEGTVTDFFCELIDGF